MGWGGGAHFGGSFKGVWDMGAKAKPFYQEHPKSSPQALGIYDKIPIYRVCYLLNGDYSQPSSPGNRHAPHQTSKGPESKLLEESLHLGATTGVIKGESFDSPSEVFMLQSRDWEVNWPFFKAGCGLVGAEGQMEE